MSKLAAILLLAVAACGGKAPVTSTTTSAPAAAAAAPAGQIGPVTLVSLENGDRACYVATKAADGTEASIEGDFELCPGASKDASALIGKSIVYTTEKANVLAASCQGDVDCGKSDQVDMVVSITAAP